MRRINLKDKKDEIVRLYLDEYKSTVELGRVYGVHASTIERRLNEWDIPIRKLGRNPIDHECFNGYSPDALYWMGYIAGDGSIYIKGNSYRVTVTSKDYEHLEKLRAFVGATRTGIIKKSMQLRFSHCICYALSFTSTNIAERLISNGITPNKSKTISITNDGLLTSPHFIRGVVDSDGCLHKNGRGKLCVSIATASHEFSQQLQEAVSRLGVYSTVGFAKQNKIYNVLITRKQEALNLCKKLYCDPSFVALERKRKIALEFIGD